MLRGNAADFAPLLLEMPPKPADLGASIEAVRRIVKVERESARRDLPTVMMRKSLVKLGYPPRLAKDITSGIEKRQR